MVDYSANHVCLLEGWRATHIDLGGHGPLPRPLFSGKAIVELFCVKCLQYNYHSFGLIYLKYL